MEGGWREENFHLMNSQDGELELESTVIFGSSVCHHLFLSTYAGVEGDNKTEENPVHIITNSQAVSR